jgi:hypothetical protein
VDGESTSEASQRRALRGHERMFPKPPANPNP